MQTLLSILSAPSVCLLVLLSGICSSFAQAVTKPNGVFSSSGALNHQIYQHAELRGVLIRVPWSAIESSPGVFDFERIEVQVAQVESQGRAWSLGVIAGGVGSPDWLIDELNVPYVTHTFRGKTGCRLPLFWSEIVMERMALLAHALADAFGTNPNLALVYVPQMTTNGLEGHLQGVSMDSMRDAGYTDELWVDAAKFCAASFARAFRDKPLAIEVHEINKSSEVPARIIQELWNDPELEQRVGAAMWWLSGHDTYQRDLIAVLTEFEGDIYAQAIARSDQTRRLGQGDYESLFRQAKSIGVRYVESWEYEFKSGYIGAEGEWDTAMADFNAWSDLVFCADAKTSSTAK